MRFVSKIGHIEKPNAVTRGIEDLLLEHWVTLIEDAVDEREALEGHDPVAHLAQSLGHDRHTRLDVTA